MRLKIMLEGREIFDGGEVRVSRKMMMMKMMVKPLVDEMAERVIGDKTGVMELLHCDRASTVAGGQPLLNAGSVISLARA